MTPILKKIGKDRAWLAKATHYSIRNINSMLSPKGEANRSDAAMARVEEALLAEQARQEAPVEMELDQNFVIRNISHEEWRAWGLSALSENKLLTDWARDELNEYAARVRLDMVADAPPSGIIRSRKPVDYRDIEKPRKAK